MQGSQVSSRANSRAATKSGKENGIKEKSSSPPLMKENRMLLSKKVEKQRLRERASKLGKERE